MSDVNYKYFSFEPDNPCWERLLLGSDAKQGERVWDCEGGYAEIYSVKNNLVKVFAYLGRGNYSEANNKLQDFKVNGLDWVIPNGVDDDLCYYLKDNGFSKTTDYYWTTKKSPRHKGVVKINGVYGGRPPKQAPHCVTGLDNANKNNMIIFMASYYKEEEDGTDHTPSQPHDGGVTPTPTTPDTPPPPPTPEEEQGTDWGKIALIGGIVIAVGIGAYFLSRKKK